MRSRWLTLIALLLALAPSWRVSADCAGWQPTEQLRRACCAACDHSAGSTSPDKCCAGAEQRQPRGTQDVPTLAHKPATPPALDTTAIGMALVRLSSEQSAVTRALDVDTRQRARMPLHLRLGQLLI